MFIRGRTAFSKIIPDLAVQTAKFAEYADEEAKAQDRAVSGGCVRFVPKPILSPWFHLLSLGFSVELGSAGAPRAVVGALADHTGAPNPVTVQD